ncbi:hypothetical protein K458DRAFT_421821 [Lentithecium fluviatile CBS 122367]|uniref:Aminoglycoside phosphotransferase domain-containing protein n=1 Tax=Lentithecium fluviatile CBS 122367 TaxID=1168545 RepID=A0A6G1IP32_9PLEO|nr:hypothetical protein K458DRAFT_421821 [Lentithecium fluviatile CBS 122367]
MIGTLRTLRPHPEEQFIGSITRGPLNDRILDDETGKGPFSDIKSFHDWMSCLWTRFSDNQESMYDPYRKDLLDNGPIIFTHGDLHRINIWS